MKFVIPSRFISWKKSPNDAVTPQRQRKFTPKMKANAVLRLLSSLVWIDQYNQCNGMTSFMEFMQWWWQDVISSRQYSVLHLVSAAILEKHKVTKETPGGDLLSHTKSHEIMSSTRSSGVRKCWWSKFEGDENTARSSVCKKQFKIVNTLSHISWLGCHLLPTTFLVAR